MAHANSRKAEILRWFLRSCSAAMLFLAGCQRSSPPEVRTPPVAETTEPKEPEPEVSLELSIPLAVNSAGWRIIYFGFPEGVHLPVLLTNKSHRPIRIWQQTNSWGYDGLSFEVTYRDGGAQIFKKRPIIVWNQNGPMFWELKPGEQVAFDADPGDTRRWEGVRWEAGLTYKIRAIYEVRPTEESNQLGVWTGRITSDAKEYITVSGSSVADFAPRPPGSGDLSKKYLRPTQLQSAWVKGPELFRPSWGIWPRG